MTKTGKPAAKKDTAKNGAVTVYKPGEKIPGDDHVNEGPPAVHELTPEQRAAALNKKIKHELSNFDIAKASVSKIVTKYDKLIVKPIENQEEYLTVEAARKHAKSLAVAVGKKEKNLKEDYLKITRAIGAYASELSIPLRGVEYRLEAEAKAWEAKLAEEQIQKELEAQAKLDERVLQLETAGIKFDGRYYSIGEHISVDIITIKESTDEEIEKLIQAVEAEKTLLDEAEAARLLEEQNKRNEEQRQRQEVDNQRIANENAARQLEEQRKELQRQQDEMLQQRTDMRVQAVLAAGLTFWPRDAIYTLNTPSGRVEIPDTDVKTLTNAEWDTRIAGARELAREIAQNEEVRKSAEIERLNRLEGRIDQLIQLGFTRQMPNAVFTNDVTKNSKKVTISDADTYSQSDWEAILKDAKAWIADEAVIAKDIQEKEAREAETKRQAGLSDLERIREYAEALNAVKVPELSLPESRAALQLFKANIDAASDTLIKAIK